MRDLKRKCAFTFRLSVLDSEGMFLLRIEKCSIWIRPVKGKKKYKNKNIRIRNSCRCKVIKSKEGKKGEGKEKREEIKREKERETCRKRVSMFGERSFKRER